MAFSYSTSILQNIRRVVSSYEPAVDPITSVRQNGGASEQRRGSLHGLPDAYPSKYLRITDKIRTDQNTSIDHWECGVRGVKRWRRLTRTPRADDDGQRVQGTYRICVCAAVQPRRLPT